MRRARPGNGALAAIDAGYILLAGGPVTGQQAAAVTGSLRAIQAAMAPWAARQVYLNFAETRHDPASFWDPQACTRLRQIKAAVDPYNQIQAHHPIPPATPPGPADRAPADLTLIKSVRTSTGFRPQICRPQHYTPTNPAPVIIRRMRTARACDFCRRHCPPADTRRARARSALGSS